ncbi:MAG: response regulator transcription factor, partial [Desulfobulbaceae bacterium]|nr:response regulator transcription factor [Desulfobulbaceae bacterium]
MIRVFLADDHQMFRQGLNSMLTKTGEIEIIGEAADGILALKELESIQPDVAIIDISMPGLNGIELCKRIRKQQAKVKVLILTMQADPYFTTEALKAGAHGYLLKEESFSSLIDSIKAVLNGKIVLSPSLQSHVVLEDAVEKSK